MKTEKEIQDELAWQYMLRDNKNFMNKPKEKRAGVLAKIEILEWVLTRAKE